MPIPKDIDQQLLATHRRTLADYLRQRAFHARPMSPAVGHSMHEACAATDASRQYYDAAASLPRSTSCNRESLVSRPYDEFIAINVFYHRKALLSYVLHRLSLNLRNELALCVETSY